MNPLNIRMKTMLGTNHSWSVVMRSIFKSLTSDNHNLFAESINGYSNAEFILENSKKEKNIFSRYRHNLYPSKKF